MARCNRCTYQIMMEQVGMYITTVFKEQEQHFAKMQLSYSFCLLSLTKLMLQTKTQSKSNKKKKVPHDWVLKEKNTYRRLPLQSEFNDALKWQLDIK